jgi:hypothetical protein
MKKTIALTSLVVLFVSSVIAADPATNSPATNSAAILAVNGNMGGVA